MLSFLPRREGRLTREILIPDLFHSFADGLIGYVAAAIKYFFIARERFACRVLGQIAQFAQFRQLFIGKGEMFFDFGGQFLLMGQRVWHVQQRAGGRYDCRNAMALQVLQDLQRLCVMVAPDIFAIDHTGEENFIGRETILLHQRGGLLALDKIQTDPIKRHSHDRRVDVADIPEVGLQQDLYRSFCCEDLFIQRGKAGDIRRRQVMDEERLIKLYPFCPQFRKVLQQLRIGLCRLFDIVRYPFASHVACQMKERKWPADHRLGQDARCLCLGEFRQDLMPCQMEMGIVLDFRYDIMVVRVEPFLHRQSLYIALFALIAMRSGKITVELRKIQLTVARWDQIKEEGCVQYAIVKGKITRGDKGNAGLPLPLPGGTPQFMRHLTQFDLRAFMAKIFFRSKF